MTEEKTLDKKKQILCETEARLEESTEKVRVLFEKWGYIVTIHGYKFDVEYHNSYLASKPGTFSFDGVLMNVSQQWRYKDAKIRVNLENVTRETNLEEAVVHELVHILMGDCEYDSIDISERVCTDIAQSIIAAYKKGGLGCVP